MAFPPIGEASRGGAYLTYLDVEAPSDVCRLPLYSERHLVTMNPTGGVYLDTLRTVSELAWRIFHVPARQLRNAFADHAQRGLKSLA